MSIGEGVSIPLMQSSSQLYGTNGGTAAGDEKPSVNSEAVKRPRTEKEKRDSSEWRRTYAVWRTIFNFIAPKDYKALTRVLVFDSYFSKSGNERYFIETFHKKAVTHWILNLFLSPADKAILLERPLDQEEVEASSPESVAAGGVVNSAAVFISDQVLPPLPGNLTPQELAELRVEFAKAESKPLAGITRESSELPSITKFVDRYIKVLSDRNPNLTIIFKQGSCKEIQSQLSDRLSSDSPAVRLVCHEVRVNEHFIVIKPKSDNPVNRIDVFANTEPYTICGTPEGLSLSVIGQQVESGLRRRDQRMTCFLLSVSALLAALTVLLFVGGVQKPQAST